MVSQSARPVNQPPSFLNDPAPGDGIGVFNIHAYGMGGVLGEAGVDGANVLIDNIVAVKVPAMAVTVR